MTSRWGQGHRGVGLLLALPPPRFCCGPSNCSLSSLVAPLGLLAPPGLHPTPLTPHHLGRAFLGCRVTQAGVTHTGAATPNPGVQGMEEGEGPSWDGAEGG